MKEKLTIEEWKEVGIKAKSVISANHELFLILRDKLPKTLWTKYWLAANKAVGKLRSHLDDIYCGEFPDFQNMPVKGIFYGNKR